MIQNFHYDDETMPIFQLETFGFRPGGVMELNFNHFQIKVCVCVCVCALFVKFGFSSEGHTSEFQSFSD